MKAPICEICLNSDILCKACQEKLDKGIITQSDVNISRIIYRFSKSLNVLKDIEIKKILESDETVVIICRKGDASKLIGKDGIIARKISRDIGKNIRVIEDANDIKEFVQSLIYPVPLLRVNIVYTPEKEIFKVVVPRGMKIPISKDDLSELTHQLFGKECTLSRE